MTDLTLTVEKTINASKEAVFNAWLNPEMLMRFMTPGEGMTVPKASNDPKVGGRFDIVMRAGENDMPHAGTYREIDPHDRLVFTWESPYSVDESLVTLTFDAVETGTQVTLTHDRFADVEARNNHEGGWISILKTLDAQLAA